MNPIQKSMEEKAVVMVRARDLPMSVKQATLLSRAINRMGIDDAIKLLEKIERQEIGLKMNLGAVKRSKAGVKYPIKASGVFIKMLKSLNANAAVKKVDPATLRIHSKTDKAARPQRPGAYFKKFKRCHVTFLGMPVVIRQKKEENKEQAKGDQK